MKKSIKKSLIIVLIILPLTGSFYGCKGLLGVPIVPIIQTAPPLEGHAPIDDAQPKPEAAQVPA